MCWNIDRCLDQIRSKPLQLAAMPIEMTGAETDDVPELNQLSPALKARLVAQDVQILEILLLQRSVRTIRALEALDTNEKSVLLVKAWALYKVLDMFPSHLRTALPNLFGNSGALSNTSNCAWPLQPGTVQTAPPAASSSPVYVAPEWRRDSSGSGGSSSSGGTLHKAGLRPTGPVPMATVAIELPPVTENDSELRKEIFHTLGAVKQLIGEDHHSQAVRCLRHSEELSMASCMVAAEALAVMSVKKDGWNRDMKELLKAAKKSLRDVIFWRSCGKELGVDSREPVYTCFEDACRHTNCDDNTVSQLNNGYLRLREGLNGGTATAKQKRAAALSPSRPGRQGLKVRSLQGDQNLTPEHRGASVSSQQPLIPEWTATPAVSAQAMAIKEIFDPASVRSLSASLAPGGHIVRAPPGLENTLPPQDAVGPQTTDRVLKPNEIRNRSMSRPQDGLNHPALTVDPRFAQGHTAVALAQALLRELERINFK